MITLINTFTVTPKNQQHLVNSLTWATKTSVATATGFVSAMLHRGVAGTRAAMYAQWRSLEDYKAMPHDPAPLPFFEEALTIANFDPGIYDVVETFTPRTE